ncbi:hypothetical protein CASFOL_019645 [Castilleja foliolosa]|uniref:AIG1-type G domain-containing protein n=1 Tax=Castilleja foliolosa TaxID=1961234 RepID=A0ABD3D8M5_9LAMI
MENGLAISEDAKVGASDAVHTELLEQRERENDDLTLDGSKDSDGGEVFEEAETATVGSDSSVTIKDGNVKLIGSLENNKGNSDLFHGFHKFEEGIRVPGVVQSPEEAGAEMENLTSEEKETGSEKSVRDETNGSTDDGMAENIEGVVDDGKADYSEITDSAAPAGETENLIDGYEKLDDSHKKPEDNISGKMSFLEALTSGGAKTLDTDNGEEPVVEMLKSVEPTDSSIAEIDTEKLDVETFPHELTGTQNSNIFEGGGVNGSLAHVNLVSDLNHKDMKSADAMKEHIHETSNGTEDEDVEKESVAYPNGDVLHRNELTASLDSGNQQDKHENNSASPHSDFEEDLVEKSCTSHGNPDDDENTELNKLDFETVQVEKAGCEVADQEENSGIAVSDTSAANHAKESSGLGCSTLSLEKNEVEPQLSSSELLAESSRSSFQPKLVDAGAEVSTKIIERREQEGVKNEKKEPDSSGNNREHEIQPSTGGISSTSDLDQADKVQEPASQDISVNGRQETKSASNISSAKSVMTSSASLTQTTPLPEPASQSTKQGIGSAAVTPSTNMTPTTPVRPAGLGRGAPLLEPSSRVVQHPRVNGAVSAPQNQLIEDPTNAEVEEYDETREKLQMIRVKFLRLAHRLGQTPHNVVVAQVLYRLGLAEQLHGRSGGRVAAFSFDRASAMAEQLEATGQEPLDFTCTIMVIGKSGVGKSATINSIFDEVMFDTDAFQLGTKKVQDIVGTVQGIRVRVIDTPGLLPSWSDQRQNVKILSSVKRFIKKTPPDIVLYLDRLDMQSRDFGDMPLLLTITDIFGPSIWFNAIVVLTHAASAPPEGPNGTATSYDMFVTQRSHVVQQAIRQAAGDTRLMNPVSLVENHSACRTNRAGQRVLPNGQVWKPHLLLLSFASKILAEANTLLKLQDTPPGRPFAPRTRFLPSLLSSLLQSRPEIKLPSEQFGDDDDGDDLDEYTDSEEEIEYDELPPFKSLTKAQLENLSKEQRKAYFDELEYREKLFMKKQLKEETKRRKMMKKLQEAAKDLPLPAEYGDNNEEETSGAASVPVPMPDLALPASFDSDNPTHRYRSLDSTPWLVRAVLEPNGWDHDIGYDGLNVERLFVAKEKIPISFSGHISKDKKDASLQLEVASSVKHGKGKSTSLGFDLQPVGKDYAYTLRSETRFCNHRINKASAGLSTTVLGDIITGGLKLEDKLTIGKRGQLVVAGGAIYGRGEVAYGGSLEATLRDKDHPLGRFLTTLGLSVMDWHGDLAIGCNCQTQMPIGRHTNLIGRFNLNNRGSGQFSLKINSSEQLQIVLIGLIPLLKKVFGYSQQAQYG